MKNFCSHGCHDKIGGFQCSCPTGLFLSSDQRNCIGMLIQLTSALISLSNSLSLSLSLSLFLSLAGCSINNGGCSQLCITNSDHYQCQCRNGYTIGSDGSTCFPDLRTYNYIMLQYLICSSLQPLKFSSPLQDKLLMIILVLLLKAHLMDIARKLYCFLHFNHKQRQYKLDLSLQWILTSLIIFCTTVIGIHPRYGKFNLTM